MANNIPTPHISAKEGEIAPSILLPGDPLRAKYIAENFLAGAKQFNSTRNMFGYTGFYRDKPISVMGTGMGCASMGIYSHELMNFYGVKKLVRLGIQCRGRYALLRYGVELVILIHGYNASLTKGRVEIGHIQNNADVAIPQNRAPRDAAALDVEAV